MDKWLASCLVSGALLHWMVVISINARRQRRMTEVKQT
jgi:hypothetical protein